MLCTAEWPFDIRIEKQELTEIREPRPPLRERLRRIEKDAEPIFGEHVWLNVIGLGAVVGLGFVLIGLRVFRMLRRGDR